MTHHSTEMTSIDDFDFTAGYGTAIVATPARVRGSALNEDWRTADSWCLREDCDGATHAGTRPRAVRR